MWTKISIRAYVSHCPYAWEVYPLPAQLSSHIADYGFIGQNLGVGGPVRKRVL